MFESKHHITAHLLMTTAMRNVTKPNLQFPFIFADSSKKSISTSEFNFMPNRLTD